MQLKDTETTVSIIERIMANITLRPFCCARVSQEATVIRNYKMTLCSELQLATNAIFVIMASSACVRNHK